MPFVVRSAVLVLTAPVYCRLRCCRGRSFRHCRRHRRSRRPRCRNCVRLCLCLRPCRFRPRRLRFWLCSSMCFNVCLCLCLCLCSCL